MRYMNFIAILIVVGLIGCATDADVLGPVEADAGNNPADAQLAGSDAVVAKIETVETTPQQLGCEEGAPCFDIAKCILHGTCQSSECVTEFNPCDDGNVCTNDVCDPIAGCMHVSNDISCTDNNGCSKNDTCNEGSCKTFGIVTCDDGNVCTDDFCSFITGECGVSYKYGTPCNDGNLCTTSEACISGSCGSGQDLNCSDDNACTLDSCDAVLGCVYTYKECDDKKVWTTNSCINGGCIHTDYKLHFKIAIDYSPPGNKPPVSMSPVLFVGNASLKPFNPSDAWTAYSLAWYYTGFSLQGYCVDPDGVFADKPHWNAGYVVHVNGLAQDNVMLGGHKVKLNIVTVQNEYSVLNYDGEQPVLLPLSGTQEYDAAGGKLIPQHYHSPNLKTICDKLIAEQAVLDKKK